MIRALWVLFVLSLVPWVWAAVKVVRVLGALGDWLGGKGR